MAIIEWFFYKKIRKKINSYLICWMIYMYWYVYILPKGLFNGMSTSKFNDFSMSNLCISKTFHEIQWFFHDLETDLNFNDFSRAVETLWDYYSCALSLSQVTLTWVPDQVPDLHVSCSDMTRLRGYQVNSSEARDGIFTFIWSIQCLPGDLSPRHQQAWFWQCRIGNM